MNEFMVEYFECVLWFGLSNQPGICAKLRFDNNYVKNNIELSNIQVQLYLYRRFSILLHSLFAKTVKKCKVSNFVIVIMICYLINMNPNTRVRTSFQ